MNVSGCLMIFILIALMIINFRIVMRVGEFLLKLLGGVMTDKAIVVCAVITILISFFEYYLIVWIGSKKLFVYDPFKEKLKQEKKKRKFIKVNNKKNLELAKQKGLTYIGYDRLKKEALYLTDEERVRHIHVIGSTGAGKSVFLFNLFRQDVELGGSVIFIDAKGDLENLAKVREIVRRAGREKDLLVLNFIQSCNTYNPLYRGNPTQLKDKIIASIVWSEPYYQRVSENMLLLLFTSVRKVLTLRQVYEILNDPTQIYKYTEKSSAAIEFVNFANTYKREKATLISEIGLIVFSDFYSMLDTVEPEIDFFDVCRNRKIVYIGIDVQSYQETSKRLGRMITEDINTTSGLIQTTVKEQERNYVSVIIDEFQAFGTENFINVLSRGRSSGFMITIAHQSLADLDMIKSGFSKQVIDNTYTKIVLPIQDPYTVETIANMIGTYKDFEHTQEVYYDSFGYGGERGSVKLVDEYIIHPNDIRQLRTGEAVYKSGRRAGIIQIPYF